MVLGRLAHYTFDAVLFSAFLAGVKRTTGLTPSVKTDAITSNDTARSWMGTYLGIGEMVMDQSVAVMSSSRWFERER